MHNDMIGSYAQSMLDQRSTTQYTENIVRFIDALRQAKLGPGLAEALDTIKLIEELGLESRSEIKAAMGALLAKSELELARFSYVFDKFFVGLDKQEALVREDIETQIVRKNMIAKHADELQFQGEALDLPEALIEVYANMPESEKEKLRDFLEQTSTGKNVGPKFRPMTENIVKGKLRRQAAANNASGNGSGRGDGMPGEDGLLYKSIAAISEEEVPRALRLINMLVHRINARISRDYKSSARRGQLDMKASIHKSLSSGGTLYKLKFKRRRHRKQRMIIICDVSSSMLLFSGFGMQFIHGLNMAADKSEVFIFSEGIERLNANDLATLNDFEKRVLSSSLWGKGTNINRAFAALEKDPMISIDGAVILIFSDAKTIQAQAAGQRLVNMRRRCKRILWMNPIPEQDWDLQPWVEAYRKQCVMLDCSTLDRLGIACAQTAKMAR